MKSFIVALTAISAIVAFPTPDNRPTPHVPAPYNPAPYNPAPYRPAQSYRDPYYSDEPVVLCPNYPYCNDAPHNIYHLQDEINLLRQRNELITQVGEKLAQQLPNRPFVGGYQNL